MQDGTTFIHSPETWTIKAQSTDEVQRLQLIVRGENNKIAK